MLARSNIIITIYKFPIDLLGVITRLGTRRILHRMNSYFLLVVQFVTHFLLACSAQKTVHSLCFSVKFANCKQLDKFSLSKQQLSTISPRQQLSNNFLTLWTLNSSSTYFQFSKKTIFITSTSRYSLEQS